jgi:hypothetical protein
MEYHGEGARSRTTGDGRKHAPDMGDRILASKSVAGGTQTRPLCPYPALAHWTGVGSTDDAANFVCN